MQVRLQRRPVARRSAFTLLEVLIVVAIIGVIAAMVVPRLIGQQRQALIDTTKSQIKQAETAINLYAKDHFGNYPKASGNEQVWQMLMQAEVVDGQTREPYLDQPVTDGWRHKLYYEWSGSGDVATSGKPKIWSSGPNEENESGGGDDINNWTVVETN
jgi:general secretion pathway protein G